MQDDDLGFVRNGGPKKAYHPLARGGDRAPSDGEAAASVTGLPDFEGNSSMFSCARACTCVQGVRPAVAGAGQTAKLRRPNRTSASSSIATADSLTSGHWRTEFAVMHNSFCSCVVGCRFGAQGRLMRRREFVTVLGDTVATYTVVMSWPTSLLSPRQSVAR
jgi:hypothetical protein